MSLDLEDSYKNLKSITNAATTYTDLKNQYKDATTSYGENFEQSKDQVSDKLNSVKENADRAKRQIKNQFENLIDVSKLTGKSASAKYLKNLLIKALKNIRPKVKELFVEETINLATGCAQNQTTNSGTLSGSANQIIYVKVQNCDLTELLKLDPNDTVGRILYERRPVEIQSSPFSMNRELYQLIQTGQPYSQLHGTLYKGGSGQPLFDIQYVKTGYQTVLDNVTQTVTTIPVQGDFFKITIANRVFGGNQIKSFIRDYYSTIDVFEFSQIIARIYDSILNCVKIQADFGIQKTKDATTFDLYIQRIFGLCFDTDQEISVSGIAKLGELDGPINDAFFDLTPIDLRNIENTVTNVQKKVVQFVECNNVDIPVNTTSIFEALENLTKVDGEEADKQAGNLTNLIKNDPKFKGLSFFGNLDVAIDTDFIKKIINGLVSALFSPKAILGLLMALKIVGENFFNFVRNLTEFMKTFSTFVGNVISKIGALLVEEIVSIIKENLFNILQVIIVDIERETADKRIIIVLKLIQLLEAVGSFVKDWRKCKSVVDDLLKFITIALTGFGFQGLPLPLIFASALMPGISTARANIKMIENLQKMGTPTGALPSGAPNMHVLSQMSQNKGLFDEFIENNKVQVGVPPLIATGLIVSATPPISSYGKCY